MAIQVSHILTFPLYLTLFPTAPQHLIPILQVKFHNGPYIMLFLLEMAFISLILTTVFSKLF